MEKMDKFQSSAVTMNNHAITFTITEQTALVKFTKN